MADREYSEGNYKSPEVSIGAIMTNSEMLEFVSVHLKSKKMCKHGVKNYLW